MTGATALERLPTGISGFDLVALGGLPAGQCTLVTGTTGTGKTLFALEFLARGRSLFDQPGVFVTFEESVDSIRRSAGAFGYPVEDWEAEGSWGFVDASPSPSVEATTVGEYNFSALISRIEAAVRRTGAARVCLDSTSALFTRFPDAASVRQELYRIASCLDSLGVTSVITSERTQEYDGVSRLHVEEFVIDNVIVLRNGLHNERRRRTIEVVKFRGAPHRSGEWLFTIAPGEGIVVIPLAFLVPREHASHERVSTGNGGLDTMCGGGVFKDAIILLTGPTGAGKTLTGLKFADAAYRNGERCLLYTYDETRERLVRNATGWGMDIDVMEDAGLLRVVSQLPEIASMEDHFLNLRSAVQDFAPNRLVIDTLSALERIGSSRALLDFVLALAAVVRQHEITTLLTAAPGSRVALAGTPAIATEIASLADVSIMFRYIEGIGQVQRAIAILQTRGSAHDDSIRGYTIDGSGMHIGDPLTGASHLLAPGISPPEPV